MTTSRIAPPPGQCPAGDTLLHWDRRCFTYAVDFRGSEDLPIERVQSIVADSYAAWQNIVCDGAMPGVRTSVTAQFSDCPNAEFDIDDGNINSIGFNANWDELDYDPLAFALTTVWHNSRTGLIYDSDIQVNENLGPYGICSGEGCEAVDDVITVDLQNVMTHEVGHFFGVAHSDIADAAMAAESPRGETAKRNLTPDDQAAFCDAFPPGSLAECEFEPFGGSDIICTDDGEGCDCSTAGAKDGWTGGFAFLLIALVGLTRRRR